MARDASELAHRLAREAEAVCRHYLSNGRRQGNYWLVGDVRNTPGRSMFVRLKGGESGKGAAGKWTDAATGGSWRSARRHSRKLRPCRLPRRRRTRLGAFSACHDRSQNRNGAVSTRRRQLGRRNRRGDCSPCRGRLRALSRKPICAIAALRLCTEPRTCASTRAAITGPTMTRRPRLGRP